MRIPLPLQILSGVCLVAGTFALLTSGPSLELFVWTLAPMATVLGIWGLVCMLVDHFPDFAKIRAEDELRLRRQDKQRLEDLELELAADARREALARAKGQVSFSQAPGEAHGDLSLSDQGALSDLKS